MKMTKIKPLFRVFLCGIAVFVVSACSSPNDVNPDDIKSEISKKLVINTTEIQTQVLVENKPNPGIEKIIEDLKPGHREILVETFITVKYSVDCSEIENIEVDPDNKTVALTLPEPSYRVDGVRIDWENTDTKTSWCRSDFTKKEISSLVEDAVKANDDWMKKDKKVIEKRAKADAENAVKAIVQQFGYNAVISY